MNSNTSINRTQTDRLDSVHSPMELVTSHEEEQLAERLVHIPGIVKELNKPTSDAPTLKNAKVSVMPETLALLVNIGKVVWATALTVSRVALVVLGFATQILPLIRDMNRLFNDAKATDHTKNIPKSANNTQRFENAETLELLKMEARKDPLKRTEYFNYYSDNVENLFTVAGCEANFTDQVVDPVLVKASRESYLNLNFVYRFDGNGMVGREFNLVYDDKGVEKIAKYKVDAFFEEKQGLVGYGLIPTDKDSAAPPRLIFRGTSGGAYVSEEGESVKLASGFTADLAGKIGKNTYKKKKKDITTWLEGATKKGTRQAVVSGHSLGGNIAQRVCADNPNFVGELFTLNSPRLEKTALPQNANENLKVLHVAMDGDFIVPKAGGGHFTPGVLLSNGKNENEVLVISGGGHTSKKLNDYCMKGNDVEYREITVPILLKRDNFWSGVINFIRPHINFV